VVSSWIVEAFDVIEDIFTVMCSNERLLVVVSESIRPMRFIDQ